MGSALIIYERLVLEVGRTDAGSPSRLPLPPLDDEALSEIASNMMLESNPGTEPVVALGSSLLHIEWITRVPQSHFMDWALLYSALSAPMLGREWVHAVQGLYRELSVMPSMTEFVPMIHIAEATLAAVQFHLSMRGIEEARAVNMVFDSYITGQATRQAAIPLRRVVTLLDRATDSL